MVYSKPIIIPCVGGCLKFRIKKFKSNNQLSRSMLSRGETINEKVMANERIKLEDTTKEMCAKMSDGNPGAMGVIMQILTSNSIDPDNIMGGIGVVLHLDSMGIYGTDIYVLHNDICRSEMPKTLAVIRAVQLGMFSRSILKDACSRQDRSGRNLVPVQELYEKVKERLPNFDSASVTSN